MASVRTALEPGSRAGGTASAEPTVLWTCIVYPAVPAVTAWPRNSRMFVFRLSLSICGERASVGSTSLLTGNVSALACQVSD